MKKSLTLSIAEPCGEDWNNFTPTDTGGFCSNCSKNVIDFTRASETDILNFFKQQPIQVCGRFRTDQLKTYPLLTPGSLKPGFVLLRAGLLSLLLLLISKPGSSQASAEKIKTEIAQQPSDSATVWPYKEIRITGVVTSDEDGSPLPGVFIIHRGTVNGTQTDGNGRFELTIDTRQSNILVFSFIGLITQEVKLRSNLNDYKISMKPDITGMEVVVIAGMVGTGRPLENKNLYSEKPPFLRRVWTKVKNVL